MKNQFGIKLLYRNLPFVYFVAALGLIYIANAHYAEKNMRKIEFLKKELKEQKWQYMSAKADLMYKSTQSEVEKSVAEMNLQTARGSVYKIENNGTTKN